MAKVSLNKIEPLTGMIDKRCLRQRNVVCITSQSFLGATKMSPLRRVLRQTMGTGTVIAYDNVPGHVFNGRKHGVFNTWRLFS